MNLSEDLAYPITAQKTPTQLGFLPPIVERSRINATLHVLVSAVVAVGIVGIVLMICLSRMPTAEQAHFVPHHEAMVLRGTR